MANSNDYFKKGLEISKDGQIFKRNSANEDDPQMTRLSEDSSLHKLGTVLAKKIKKDNPELYLNVTKKNDANCDIRQKKGDKNKNVYGIFEDGKDEPTDEYKVSPEDIRNASNFSELTEILKKINLTFSDLDSSTDDTIDIERVKQELLTNKYVDNESELYTAISKIYPNSSVTFRDKNGCPTVNVLYRYDNRNNQMVLIVRNPNRRDHNNMDKYYMQVFGKINLAD